MAPIRNRLQTSIQLPLYLLVVLCAAPLAARAQEPGETAAKSQNAAVGSQAEDPAIAAIDAFIAKEKVNKSKPSWKSTLAKPPKVAFTPGKVYYWNLVTNKGKMKIKLMPEVAPMHVSSTIYLTRLGFYDDTIFHRVITGFMAQGGDPTGSGSGNPGYKYDGEFDASVKHNKPGILSTANSGPGTDGSQFFLTFVKTPNLNGKHTIFGQVVEGMDTLKQLEKFGAPRGCNRNCKPKEELLLESATISVD